MKTLLLLIILAACYGQEPATFTGHWVDASNSDQPPRIAAVSMTLLPSGDAVATIGGKQEATKWSPSPRGITLNTLPPGVEMELRLEERATFLVLVLRDNVVVLVKDGSGVPWVVDGDVLMPSGDRLVGAANGGEVGEAFIATTDGFALGTWSREAAYYVVSAK